MEPLGQLASAGGLRLAVLPDGWELRGAGLRLRAAPPELRGSAGPQGLKPWTLRLPFESAGCTESAVAVPNVGEFPGLVVAGLSPAEAQGWRVRFRWTFYLLLRDEDLLLRLELHLENGQSVRAEHVCLAPLTLSKEEDEPGPPPPGGEVAPGPARPCQAGLWKLLRGAPARRGPEHSAFLVNGWQSFGFSGVLHGAAPQPRTSLPYFSAAFHEGAKLPPTVLLADPEALVSDMFGVFWLHGAGGVLGGFLSQSAGFGGLAAHSAAAPTRLLLFTEVGAELCCGKKVGSDWAMILPFPSGAGERSSALGCRAMQQYLEAVGKHRKVPSPAYTPIGWCSWYCHGPNVCEALMADSLQRLVARQRGDEFRFNLFQLDDGWQSAWGDWLAPHRERFPNGLRPLVDKVVAAGMVPGIWLAPAALVGHSRLAAEHPEWLLRDDLGRPVRCGFTAPGLWMLALDLTNPDVQAHVRNVIRTIVHEWGFRYLKCDFLHCAAMPGACQFDPHVPRCATLERLMATIREAAGESVFILACGAPLGPCIGHANAIRVSADTAEHWLPVGPNMPGTRWFFAGDRTNLPAARNMVCSTLARLSMHGSLWVNDPDCLILRCDVPLAEARALATVAALSAGSLIFSDSLDTIVAERLAILRALIPPLPHAAQFVDHLAPEIPRVVVAELQPHAEANLMGSWHLVALFNWTDGERVWDAELALPPPPLQRALANGNGTATPAAAVTAWHVFEFWTRTYTRHLAAAGALRVPAIPPRGCRLFAIRPVQEGVPQVVGSDVHVSCGREVTRWAPGQADQSGELFTAEVAIGVGRAVAEPRLWLYLPGSAPQRPPRVVAAGGSGGGGATAAPVAAAAAAACTFVRDEVWEVALPPAPASGGHACGIQW